MVYHTVIILLCEPFLKGYHPDLDKKSPSAKCQITPEETSHACMLKRIEKAHDTCSASVRAMCFISQKYRRVFGSFKLSPITATHCTLSYALIIIERCCSMTAKTGPGDEVSSAVSPHNAVWHCLQVLRELSTSWNIAKRIGRNLEKLYLKRYGDDHLPFQSQTCDRGCEDACSCQTAGADPMMFKLPSLPGEAFDAFFDSEDMTFEWPQNFNITTPSPMQHHVLHNRSITGGIQSVPDGINQDFSNSEELFANNLGFAFSPDCLPSDYNMFDTLNQMYLETW